MIIKIEHTPNPDALKFILDFDILKNKNYFFHKNDNKQISPLVNELFNIDGILSVFVSKNFITITKNRIDTWEKLEQEILIIMSNYLNSGKNIIDISHNETHDEESINISKIEQQIIEVIDTYIRPSIEIDGGDITYCGFHNGIVKLKLLGACSGCPSAAFTLKNGIETTLKHFIPEVTIVEEIE